MNNSYYKDLYFGKSNIVAEVKDSYLKKINASFFDDNIPYVRLNKIVDQDNDNSSIKIEFDDLGEFLSKANISDIFLNGRGIVIFDINKESFEIEKGRLEVYNSSIKNSSF